jgi:4-amino-4-deoxy-L-arabinose transferase-like glycosyltransferase
LHRSRVAHGAALVAILALAAILRFHGLIDRGFIYWDEGKFALEGAHLHDLLREWLHAGGTAPPGKAIGTAKPMHALLIAFADAIVGTRDYAALLLDVVASVAGVLLIYALGRTLFNTGVGLLSALFLAVSPYDVVYARSALSESDANAFFLAGLVVWVSRRGQGARLATACLLGMAFTINYRLIVYCAVVVAIDVLRSLRTRMRYRVIGEWLAGLVIAPAIWQVVDVIARARGVILFRNEFTGRPVLYLEQALYQLHQGKQSAVHFEPLPYLLWYVRREGWPVAVLILAGLVWMVLTIWGSRTRFPEDRYRLAMVPALVVVPYVVYVFAPFVVPRNLDATIPFASILAAVAVWEIPGSIRSLILRSSVQIAAVLLVIVMGIAFIWPLGDLRSGFVGAARYLKQHGQDRALVTNETMRFYLRNLAGVCRAPVRPKSPLDLPIARRLGYRYAVIDTFDRPASKYVQLHAPLVARYPLGSRSSWGENLVSVENGNEPDLSALHSYVYVYSLNFPALPLGRSHREPTCSLNKP